MRTLQNPGTLGKLLFGSGIVDRLRAKKGLGPATAADRAKFTAARKLRIEGGDTPNKFQQAIRNSLRPGQSFGERVNQINSRSTGSDGDSGGERRHDAGSAAHFRHVAAEATAAKNKPTPSLSEAARTRKNTDPRRKSSKKTFLTAPRLGKAFDDSTIKRKTLGVG